MTARFGVVTAAGTAGPYPSRADAELAAQAGGWPVVPWPEEASSGPEDRGLDDEVVVALADGWTLRSWSEVFQSGDYVRLCRPDGSEYLYWDQAEWRDDPALVMGAIINAAAGRRFDGEADGGR